MFRLAWCLVSALFVLGGSFSDAAAQVALNRKKLPVYYKQAGAEGNLEIEFSEKPYKISQQLEQFGGFKANVTIEENKESVGAEEVLIHYMNKVLAGEYDQLDQHYVPGLDAEAMTAVARDLRGELKGLTEIHFISEWFYKSAKFVLVRLMFGPERSKVMGFGFKVTVTGFLLSDHWGPDDQSVHRLFRYLVANTEEGGAVAYRPRPFDHSIEILPGIFGMTVNVDGQLYEESADWIEPGGAAPGRTVPSFVEQVLGGSAAMDEGAFRSLWCRADRGRLDAIIKNQPVAYADTKQAHVARGAIKHVMTMKFADDYVHYFTEADRPKKVRALFVAKNGTGYCLSAGPSRELVRAFLTSESVHTAVRRLWASQS